jgi:hypothetical protein
LVDKPESLLSQRGRHRAAGLAMCDGRGHAIHLRSLSPAT